MYYIFNHLDFRLSYLELVIYVFTFASEIKKSHANVNC